MAKTPVQIDALTPAEAACMAIHAIVDGEHELADRLVQAHFKTEAYLNAAQAFIDESHAEDD